MKNFKTFSTNDITSRKKNNFLSPLKAKGAINKNKHLLNLKIINNFSSELDIYNKNKLFPNNIKTLTIEEYDKLQNNFLNKYKSIEDENEQFKIENNNKKKINKKNNSNSSNKTIQNDVIKILNTNKSEKIFVKSQKKNYDPKQSLKIINSNNNIFNSISKDSLLRQQILYDKSVKIFENYAMKFKTKMPKIKMSSINSKIADYIPMINLIENEKKQEHGLPAIPSSEDLRLFSYFKYPEKNFPEGREQFSICIKGRHIFLSGGISTKMKEMNFWSLNIKNLEWKKINSINQTNSRFGHTTVYDENKIYIYGGRIKEKNTSVLVGLEIYSLKDNNFYKPYIQNEPPDRRDHIALNICNYMLIHGGIGSSNEILSDCYLLNFQTLKWIEPQIEQNTQRPKVYGHTCCLVIPFQLLNHKNFNIYKFPDIDIDSKYKIKQKGLFIFGGKSKEEGGLTNDLWILIMGQKPLSWIKVNALGKPPSPRYFHSMDYYEKANYLIIHGGRNDDLSSTSALDDTYILDLENFGWVNVKLYSNTNQFKVISRYGHKSAIFSNKLIIFGGMNNNNFIGSSLFIVNLDFYYSIDQKTIEQMNIENIRNNDKITHGKKKKIMKIELGKLKLGVVLPLNLPPIK
jgi:hypothetical protein